MISSPFKTVTIAGSTSTLDYSISEPFLNDGSYIILRRKSENEDEKAKLLASMGAENCICGL